ncbi:MAG: endonuclease/exonuclease/phosphatase family protein [Gammaproteobacteria bacterium]|nr:endonuclease/exonuclease/phosphatase family protein [Gammaproteobacteria bacterium]MDH5730018.1 endonuclease/exonuclease/phosphatase family protein [Gammaproteobacteria bacterium]
MSDKLLFSHNNSFTPGNRIKLLSYNVQVGMGTSRPHHYVTKSWKHVLPHAAHFNNLDQIAELVKGYDIVGLQEVDAGSIRSSYVNQTAYLAEKAEFAFWQHQTNRNLGHFAKHSNGLLCQYPLQHIEQHKLPGRLPGRGAMIAFFGAPENPLVVVLLHLALGKKARQQQLLYISNIVSAYEHVVLMGDLNCQPESEEMLSLLQSTDLRAPVADLLTFPSWKPSRMLDHILVSPSLRVHDVSVVDVAISDHLPISMDVTIPGAVGLAA